MKKAICLILALALVLGLVGCGARNAGNELTFSATVLEISGDSVIVSPLEDELEIRNSSDKISFSTAALEDIGVAVGDVVSVTYDGLIRESYPAGITATSWSMVEKADAAVPEQSADDGSVNGQPSDQVYVLFSADRREYKADDGTLILSFSYADAEVKTAGGQQAADAVNTELRDIKSGLIAGGQPGGGLSGMLADAGDEYAGITENPEWTFYYYTLERSFTVGRLDEHIFSLRAEDYIYKGGAHGSSFGSGIVFDAVTGQRLELADIGEDVQALADFAQSYITQLAGEHENSAYWDEDYDTSIGAVITDYNWYFDEEGLVFICNTNVIGPYFVGGAEFTVPYSELEGLLKDEYMPIDSVYSVSAGADVAHIAYEGSVDTQRFDGLLGQSGGGNGAAEPSCIIWFDETVRDVRLESVTYLGYEDDFAVSGVIFAANIMTVDNALRWPGVVPEGMPDTRLVYTLIDGVEVTRYISYNGRTGEPMLSQYQPQTVTVRFSVEGETISKEYRRYGTALFETVYDPEELTPSEDPESGTTRFIALSGADLELDVYSGAYSDYASGAEEERRQFEANGFICGEIRDAVVGDGYNARSFTASDDTSIREIWVVEYVGSYSGEGVSCVVFAAKMPAEYAEGWGPRFGVMLDWLSFR